MRHNPGIKQEVIVIGFSARNGIRRANLAAGDILLLGITDKIIDPVFRPLITHAAADSEDIVQVIAGLQERRQVGDAVARVTAGGEDGLIVQAAGRHRLAQIEEHLIGVEGFMVGVDSRGQVPAVQRLAIQGDFRAVLIGILL